MARAMAGEARSYDDSYWAKEMAAVQERNHGASLIRIAEVFHYARRPIRRFLDVSTGAGTLLDAAAELLPEIADTFWGIEPFPPPPQFRARHPNYRIGFLRDLDGRFDGGTCIEVIEHLPPEVLKAMLAELAALSEPGALWYFNSAQPSFVLRDDPGYLDPHSRGHVASYSVEGLRHVFAAAGFTLHALPGRDWAFLAEHGTHPLQDANALLDRVWTMLPENRDWLDSARFGPLLRAAGQEGARCYLEGAIRTWAVKENARLAEVDTQRNAQARLDAVLTSTSWRMNGPMRSVVQRLRGRQALTTHPESAIPAPAVATPTVPASGGLELVAHLGSLADWQAWLAQHAATLTREVAQRIVGHALREGLTTPMFGAVGADAVELRGEDPRECLVANGLNSRLRAVLQVLSWHERAHDIWNTRIYAHEALTPFALAMRSRYPRFMGSEYAPDAAAAKALWPVPAVDITLSPFPDAAFDFVLTNEVLEHIPDLIAGLRDTARILAPGGQLIGTFPFHDQTEATEIYARLTPAGIEHLRPPEYHGNPVDPEGGSLVFQVPGWDILAMCRAAGFASARMVFTGSVRHGITGRNLPGVLVLVATR
jgi:SAM-dependent methyltransferase